MPAALLRLARHLLWPLLWRSAPLKFLLPVAVVGASLAGCATAPPASDPEAVAEYNEANDPLEPTNRFFYRVQDGIFTYVLRPVALGYRAITTPGIRDGVHNALSNLATAPRLVNDMFEGKPRRAGDTAMRFAINTTAGVVGIFDVAADWGYPGHDNDFGLTLALWGVESGPYLFLPILGPTNPRDAAGFAVDQGLDPFTYVGQGTLVDVLKGVRFPIQTVSDVERVLDQADQLKRTALDPYATIRSATRQNRQAAIETVRDDNRATIPAWFPQQAGNQ